MGSKGWGEQGRKGPPHGFHPRRVQHHHLQHPGYRCPNHPPAPPSSFHHPLPLGNGCLDFLHGVDWTAPPWSGPSGSSWGIAAMGRKPTGAGEPPLLSACFPQTKCHQQLSLGAPGTRPALEEPPALKHLQGACCVSVGLFQASQSRCKQPVPSTQPSPPLFLLTASTGQQRGPPKILRTSYNQHAEGGWTQLFNGHLPVQRAGCGAPSPAPCSPRPTSVPAPKIIPNGAAASPGLEHGRQTGSAVAAARPRRQHVAVG